MALENLIKEIEEHRQEQFDKAYAEAQSLRSMAGELRTTAAALEARADELTVFMAANPPPRRPIGRPRKFMEIPPKRKYTRRGKRRKV